MPRFSVIVPTYARPRRLQDAVQSVLSQTVGDFEIIVVDDGSPEPLEVVDDPRVRMIRRERNGGPAAARNTGIEAARGGYLAFLDDDDLFTPDRLEMVSDELETSPVVLCWTGYVGQTEHRPGRIIEGIPGGELLASTVPHMGSAVVARDSIVLLDETYRAMEDVEWWLRMSDRRVTTVPSVGYLWHRREDVRVEMMDERIEGAKRLLQEHHRFFDQHPNAAAYRWDWIGMTEARLGRRRSACAAYSRAMRLRPSFRLVARMALTVFGAGMSR